MADRVGEQLGNYRLLKLIGRGGFADVYLGEHVRLGNQAAIKVLQARLVSEDIEAFQREARTIGRLTHPHIVRVFDFAVQDGTPFLAMDYAPNGTLRQRYARGERVPLETILLYVKQVADALQYAHEQRVIHRDIKPENMLVGRLDDILLSDFGIAVISQSERYQTEHGMMGTVGYMAPEQIQGHPRPASDQYSLAIVVYEWLCGERPFHGGVTEVATQQLVASPPPLRAKVPLLSTAVEDVVMTALAKDPAQRFGSVRAFAVALENAARAAPSIYSLSTQLSTPTVLSSPPGAPSGPTVPAQGSGPSGAPGAGSYFPAASQESASTPYAPTVAASSPSSAPAWSDAATVQASLPVEGAQAYGAPPTPAGGYGGSSQPWGYGAPDGSPPVGLPPPPPPTAPQSGMYAPPVGPGTGAYMPPVAPVLTAPPKPRRSPVLWIAIALVALLVVCGGGGALAFTLLSTKHPTIKVTSSFAGSSLGGPPDTVLHITGQQFASNSAVTILLDGARAPGSSLVQSDGNGAIAADVTITDDWTFATHTLKARDARGNETEQGVAITVVPQPVLDVESRYSAGGDPAGADKTVLDIIGKRFEPNSRVTILLDGKQAPGSQPTQADARGRVQTSLEVNSDWTLGKHTITAQDEQGHTTQSGSPVVIVKPGEAGTPGPNGAPTDSASFSIFVTVRPSNGSSFSFTLGVINGKVCAPGDDGKPHTRDLEITDVDTGKPLGTATEHYTPTCSGTYKGGKLTYKETYTSNTFNLSDGGYCVANTPRVVISLQGTFSGPFTISGKYSSAARNITCPTINTFYLVSDGAKSGTWTGNGG